MKNYPEIGTAVEVCVSSLPPSLKRDTFGVVVDRDGEYISIVLNKSEVLVERYANEIWWTE